MSTPKTVPSDTDRARAVAACTREALAGIDTSLTLSEVKVAVRRHLLARWKTWECRSHVESTRQDQTIVTRA